MSMAVSENRTGEYVVLARIGRPRGVRGHFYIWPIADNLERFEALRTIYLVNRRGRLAVEVEAFEIISGKPILKVRGIDTPEDARAWNTGTLEIDEAERISLPEGEYFHDQLEGLTVVDPGGNTVGTLTKVLETPANDVYECRTTDGRVILIPAVEDFILEIDLNEGTMKIDPVPGLLED